MSHHESPRSEALVAYRICDEKSESISDREGDCHGSWQLIKRAVSSCIEKRAMLSLIPTATCLMLSLAYVVYVCPPLRAIDVYAVRYPSTLSKSSHILVVRAIEEFRIRSDVSSNRGRPHPCVRCLGACTQPCLPRPSCHATLSPRFTVASARLSSERDRSLQLCNAIIQCGAPLPLLFLSLMLRVRRSC
jgi:hypothetical protein